MKSYWLCKRFPAIELKDHCSLNEYRECGDARVCRAKLYLFLVLNETTAMYVDFVRYEIILQIYAWQNWPYPTILT